MGEVRLIDVSKRFALRIDGAVQTVRALDRLSFTVADGEVVALIGPSGCGKTTALRIAMGLENASDRRGHGRRRRQIKGCGYDRGIVFQHAELLPWLNALRNVEFGLEMKGMRGGELRDTAMKYLTLVALRTASTAGPISYRGGMQQRVGIARALAIDPKVLLMDEPFGALDAQTREGLQGELLDIHARTKKTILFVTHDLDEAVAARRPRGGDAARPRAGDRRRCRCRVRATISQRSAARTHSRRRAITSGSALHAGAPTVH